MAIVEKVKKILYTKFPFANPSKSVTTNNEMEDLDENFVQAVHDLNEKKKERAARANVLWKRRKYYNHFHIRKRYNLSHKQFNRKVDAGTWEASLAEDQIYG